MATAASAKLAEITGRQIPEDILQHAREMTLDELVTFAMYELSQELANIAHSPEVKAIPGVEKLLAPLYLKMAVLTVMFQEADQPGTRRSAQAEVLRERSAS
jgi:hypothetical protein